jgi:hypothetical protein
MLVTFKQGYANVVVSAEEVRAFNSKWPCSPIPAVEHTFLFAPNGDLVGVSNDTREYDGEALTALSQDAGMKVASKLSDMLEELKDTDADDPTSVFYHDYRKVRNALNKFTGNAERI